jgi:hypothetical protein
MKKRGAYEEDPPSLQTTESSTTWRGPLYGLLHGKQGRTKEIVKTLVRPPKAISFIQTDG